MPIGSSKMCVPCAAAWGEGSLPSEACREHTPEVEKLAAEMCRSLQPTVTSEYVGWYMDDAVEALAQLGPQTKWVVKSAGFEGRGADGGCALIDINGVVFECNDGPIRLYDPSLYEEEESNADW